LGIALADMNREQLVRKAKAAANQLVQTKGYVSLVEVCLAMGHLSKTDYERWRFRQVPHLEKVLPGSLNQHSYLCHQLRGYLRNQLKLKPSRTAYMSWGKGRRMPLRFTKYGQSHLEELWSIHYVACQRPSGESAAAQDPTFKRPS
jgi:hypothetical protein